MTMEQTPAEETTEEIIDEPRDEAIDEQDVLTQASDLLEGILQRMGYELEVEASDDGQRIVLDIIEDDDGALIGPKGQTLDALQYVLARAMNNRGVKRPIIVDDGGYRGRRKEALLELAQKLLEEARSTGKTLAVNPMSAHDRRVIHVALKEEPGVITRSEGEGIYRRVLIVPQRD